jgi:hypothetical protein
MKLYQLAILSVVLLLTTAFTAHKASQKQGEASLPQSEDNAWKIFATSKVSLDDKTQTYSIDLTPEVKAMVGKELAISGFILPLESTEKFTHYLLSKRTPTCPFCPPGEGNEIIEVFTKDPITWEKDMVVVTGIMKLTNNPDMGLFFQLKDAETVRAESN